MLETLLGVYEKAALTYTMLSHINYFLTIGLEIGCVYFIYNPSAGKILSGSNWQVTHQIRGGVRVVQMLILQAYK